MSGAKVSLPISKQTKTPDFIPRSWRGLKDLTFTSAGFTRLLLKNAVPKLSTLWEQKQHVNIFTRSSILETSDGLNLVMILSQSPEMWGILTESLKARVRNNRPNVQAQQSSMSCIPSDWLESLPNLHRKLYSIGRTDHHWQHNPAGSSSQFCRATETELYIEPDCNTLWQFLWSTVAI